MSTVGRVNFEPVSDILAVQRRDFPLADKALAQPDNSVALYDGEWMTLDAASKLIRAAVIGGGISSGPSWPLFMERGRSDVLGMADVKTMILWLGQWEFDTRIYDAAVSLGTDGAAIATVGQPLMVGAITLGSRNYIGLVGHTGGATDPIVARVTRLPAANGNKLRIRGGMYF